MKLNISNHSFNKKQIEVVPCNPDWVEQYEQEAAKIKVALGANCIEVHHVGSTSVAGLSAKPKVDIIAEVRELSLLKKPLEALGYNYRGGFNIPLRKTFTLRMEFVQVNLHVFEENDPEIEMNLLFRNYLRENEDARVEYEAIKYKLLEEESSHIVNNSMYTGYTLGKNDFIQKIIEKTGFDDYRFYFCVQNQEIERAKYLRQKYFFSIRNIEDPYIWTFNHDEHKHFVLYKGIKIISYAHVQLFGNTKALIRIIVTDEAYRNLGAGSKLLSLIEKYLRIEGYKSIHAESRQSSLKFYLNNGYSEMECDEPDIGETSSDDVMVGKLLRVKTSSSIFSQSLNAINFR